MNTIIFTTKFLEYAVSDKDDVFVIQSKEDIEIIKEKFQKHLVSFTEKVKVLNDLVQKAAFKLTDYDYDNLTLELKDFQDKYDEWLKKKMEETSNKPVYMM